MWLPALNSNGNIALPACCCHKCSDRSIVQPYHAGGAQHTRQKAPAEMTRILHTICLSMDVAGFAVGRTYGMSE